MKKQNKLSKKNPKRRRKSSIGQHSNTLDISVLSDTGKARHLLVERQLPIIFPISWEELTKAT